MLKPGSAVIARSEHHVNTEFGPDSHSWVNPPDPTTGNAQARFRFGKTSYNFFFYPSNAAAIFPYRSSARYVTARWLPKEIDVDKYDYKEDESFQRLAEFIVHFMQAVSEYVHVVQPEILALVQLPTEIEPILNRMWAMLLPDYLAIEPHRYVRKDVAGELTGAYKKRFERRLADAGRDAAGQGGAIEPA